MLFIEEKSEHDRTLNELMLWERKEILLGNFEKAKRISDVFDKLCVRKYRAS